MYLTNKPKWALQTIVDGVSGQLNRTVLEQRFQDYGLRDYEEKPLRQKLNQILYECSISADQIEKAITSLEEFDTNFNSRKSIYRTVIEPASEKNKAIELINGTAGGLVMRTSEPNYPIYKDVWDSAPQKALVDAEWADTPDVNPVPVNATGNPLVNGREYIIQRLHNPTTNKEHFAVVENDDPYTIPNVAKNEGYIYMKIMFPFVWSGGQIVPFYSDMRRIYFQNPQEITISFTNVSPNQGKALPITDVNGSSLIVDYDNNHRHPTRMTLEFFSPDNTQPIDLIGKFGFSASGAIGWPLTDIAEYSAERFRLYNFYRQAEISIAESYLFVMNTGGVDDDFDVTYRPISYENPYYLS